MADTQTNDGANMSNYKNAGSELDINLDVKEIAKRLRVSIKAMQKAGIFSDMKVSVRISRYSMGQGISVEITKWDGRIYNPEFVKANHLNRDTSEIERHPARAAQALKVLRLMGDQWNYNNSDSRTDYYEVNYHLDVRFEVGMANEDYAAVLAS
jgi:hypothetical protein